MKLSMLLGVSQEVDVEVTGITSDSRQVKPGFIFAALQGTLSNGEEFIPQAEEAGAVAILAREGVKTTRPLIAAKQPRETLAHLAAKLYAGQPEVMAGVTGTNGKTSIARFCQQLWLQLGLKAGSLGTLGAFAPSYEYTLRHTTPDPVEIHQVLSTMTKLGTTHLAMEVSSHGLSQNRADGVVFDVAGFTNITQDHLDYHKDFDDYFDAKMRLFTDLLKKDGTIVVNTDGAGHERVIKTATARGVSVKTVGRDGQDIKLISTKPLPSGQLLTLEYQGREDQLTLPLVGYFQAENALVAASMVAASGFDLSKVIPLLSNLKGAPGRMEHVADRDFGDGDAGIYVDYAHTPDAIETALKAIRPHTDKRVIVIIGAGGDRDKAKRPLMGNAANELADLVIVTDDNPRTEDPAQIRSEIMAACPEGVEVADREKAIAYGIEALEEGDILLIAGKGHETGQTIGTETMPFNDAEIAQSIVGNG